MHALHLFPLNAADILIPFVVLVGKLSSEFDRLQSILVAHGFDSVPGWEDVSVLVRVRND